MIERLVDIAMHEPQTFVLSILYEDRNGVETNRIISPIKPLQDEHILALCLGREHPRQFVLSRIKRAKLVDASQVLMPERIEVIR